ncbi:electron transport complex subunit RsxA [Lacrimispora sp.]|jgi:electron transport complex protein RnfA|uniref:electron transport complex subunit RsxA n=1 Tax=Lacrimispora sp. TaxID=2719234 RepID=UPI00289967CC|nr:electron transport complex subunit RsxA [Lacrimispora sp.]
MKELLLIAIGSALVNNVVLSQFLGLCPFLGVSKNVKTSAGMGAAVIFVITIAAFATSLIYKGILVGMHLEFLQTIVFILVIAALVQFVEMFLKKSMPALYEALGVYLPLITTNCAVLGVALTNVQKAYNILESVVNGVGISVGFTIAIVMLAGVRERIENNDVPHSFKGSPIVLITSGLMAIAFFGFSGLIK